MDKSELEQVKLQIIMALQHQEAEEGLYLRNFFHLHEEDERPAVLAPEEDIVDALNDLIDIGIIRTERDPAGMIFLLQEDHKRKMLN